MQNKINAIDGLEFGTVDKLYLEFEKPFWLNDRDGFAFLWRPEELKVIRELGKGWLESVVGFFPVSHQPNILCGWLTGPSARQVEQLPDDEVKTALMSLLRMCLHTYDVPDATNFKRFAMINLIFRGFQQKYLSYVIVFMCHLFQVQMVFESTFPWLLQLLFIEKYWIWRNNK